LEILLQVWDELDDWYGCVRHVWLGMRTDITDVPLKLTQLEVTFVPGNPVAAQAD
jgi:hypothetical protein